VIAAWRYRTELFYQIFLKMQVQRFFFRQKSVKYNKKYKLRLMQAVSALFLLGNRRKYKKNGNANQKEK
jgi:hypothetical protein